MCPTWVRVGYVSVLTKVLSLRIVSFSGEEIFTQFSILQVVCGFLQFIALAIIFFRTRIGAYVCCIYLSVCGQLNCSCLDWYQCCGKCFCINALWILLEGSTGKLLITCTLYLKTPTYQHQRSINRISKQ